MNALSKEKVFVALVDNGSRRPGAYLELKAVADALSKRVGIEVTAAPSQHVDKVAREDLGGKRAGCWESVARMALERGIPKLAVIPFFLGPSLAVTELIPEQFDRLKKDFPMAELLVAPTVFPGAEADRGEVAAMLEVRVKEAVGRHQWEKEGEGLAVVVVDHGSPIPEVTFVRNYVAGQLAERLRGQVGAVVPASMERREGDFYAFNEPLLEDALVALGEGFSKVVVAMMFLSPGRHAGDNGDVAQICERVRSRRPETEIVRTGLLAQAPGMLDLLERRVRWITQFGVRA